MEKEYTCYKKSNCCYFHENKSILENKICAACIYREKIVEETMESPKNYCTLKDSESKSCKKTNRRFLYILAIIFLLFVIVVFYIEMSKNDSEINKLNDNNIKANANKDNQLVTNSNEISSDSIKDSNVTESPTITNSNKDILEEYYVVEYIVSSNWENSAIVDVKVFNDNDSIVEKWYLEWEFSDNQNIEEIWNADFKQENNTVIITGKDYNKDILANGLVDFGFKLSYTKSNQIPEKFSLNGKLCLLK